jgi:hypothetical protein
MLITGANLILVNNGLISSFHINQKIVVFKEKYIKKTYIDYYMDDLTKINKNLADISSQITEVRRDIHTVIAPKFLDISVQTNDLVEHAIELWRFEKRIVGLLEDLPETQREILLNSIKKMMRYIEKNDIEIVGHTNQKYNEGRNLDVLAFEKSDTVSEPTIKETKEPTVLFKGQVIRKGKVIVSVSKLAVKEEKNE